MVEIDSLGQDRKTNHLTPDPGANLGVNLPDKAPIVSHDTTGSDWRSLPVT